MPNQVTFSVNALNGRLSDGEIQAFGSALTTFHIYVVWMQQQHQASIWNFRVVVPCPALVVGVPGRKPAWNYFIGKLP